jgi:hypothetical protein
VLYLYISGANASYAVIEHFFLNTSDSFALTNERVRVTGSKKERKIKASRRTVRTIVLETELAGSIPLQVNS